MYDENGNPINMEGDEDCASEGEEEKKEGTNNGAGNVGGLPSSSTPLP
jgi:hypothetical protein